MEVTDKWWVEQGLWDSVCEKGAVEVKGKHLTHVVHVRVRPPRGRAQSNPDCYIYGDISVNVGLSGDPVTLYRRGRDNPDLLDLSNPVCCDLALTDGHEGERPLGAVSKDNPLYLTMKLKEKTGSSTEEDALVAKHTNFKYYDPRYDEEDCSFCLVKGEFEFVIEVCYSVVFGARAEVVIRIEKGLNGNGLDGKVAVWGDIAAWQNLRDPTPSWPYTVSETTLINIFEDEEKTYNIGERIELQRRFVVAPMRHNTYLSISIGLAVVIPADADCADGEWKASIVYFPLNNGHQLHQFITNKDMSHTKLIEHVSGTVFSVTLNVFHPVTDDINVAHSSFKRPRSPELEQEHDDGGGLN